MILILEVTTPQAAELGPGRCKKFGPAGGAIGRNNQSDWVLPHAKVSACHARISFSNGSFYLEDMSTNGVFLNARANRLTRGRPQVLRSGDRIIIDPYEIEVSIDVSTPLHHDPFGPAGVPSRQDDALSTPVPSVGPDSEPELDPLVLLDAPPKRRPAPQARSARDLEASSGLGSHFKPPAVPGRFTGSAASPGDRTFRFAVIRPDICTGLRGRRASGGPARAARLACRERPRQTGEK